MKRTSSSSILLSLLLIYSLIFSSWVQASQIGASVKLDLPLTASELTADVPADPVAPPEGAGPLTPQEELLDAATRNMLAGMSGTRKEIALIVINTVNKSGAKLVGVGSWISGGKYIDPILQGGTSDHDLRLVMDNVDEAQAIGRWRAVRENIASQVRAKFGSKADDVLKTINLYPPEAVLEGIDDAEEALQKLKDLKINPNLGGAQAEGLWGKGSKAFRDSYEATSGRVFWKNGSRVSSGFADLLPLGETRGVYTIGGSANTASQFADKVDDALKKYDAKTVRKNLHRLRDSLKKSRDLARMERADYLDDLIKKFDAYGDDLDGLRKELINPSTRQALDSLVGKAKLDSQLLKKFAESSNPRDLKLLKEMLEEGTGRWARVKNALSEASSHVPWGTLMKGFMAFMVFIQVKQVAGDLKAGDYEKAFQSMLVDAGFMASLPAGLLTLIVSSIIEDAKDAGYALVASYQDCEDLIAGIYEVKGREQVSSDQLAETNVAQLALKYTEKDDILKIVEEHARIASSRDLEGKVTKKVDEEVAKKLIARCGPQIVGKWTNRRAEMIGDAAEMLLAIDKNIQGVDVIRNTNPEPAKLKDGRVDVLATATFSSPGVAEAVMIDKYIAALRALGGDEHLVAVSVQHSYRWSKDGSEVSFDEEDFSPGRPIFNRNNLSRTFTFEGEEPHTAKLTYILSIDVTTVADDVMAAKDYLTRNYAREIPFEISVIGDGTPTPTPTPTQPPTATPTASPTAKPTGSATPTKPKPSPTAAPGPTGPTEAELKARYMNCLCRCYCGWAGHIGVWWDPENKSKPECESSGPCFGGAGAFGCTSRHSFGAPNECSKSCWEGAYGKGTYDEKKADQMRREENRKHMKPLKLKLDKPTCPINVQLGETVNFAATIEGGIPPYKVTWSGNGSPKDNNFTFANSRQPGTYPISVSVSDDEGNSATASCSVVVEAMTVKIEMAEKDSKVTFGGTRGFTATVMSGGKPARGNFYFLWQPHPEITFAPFEYNGGNASTTKATFNRIGAARVWAVAHTRQGETLTTVGESDQIDVEVGKPELKLTLTPQKSIVGSEIKAKVTTNVPGLKEVDYRWDVSTGGKLMGQSQDTSEITFIPQSAKPVTITVNARAPGVGDDLGMQKAIFTADPANVNVVILGAEGPKPQVWKPNVGLVTLEKEIAVHQFVGIKAEVSPAIDGARFEWSVNEDTHIVGSNISQQIRVTRSQVGGGEATVIVKNKDGLELGRATGSFSVSISQEEIDKAKDMGGTTKKLAEAKALVGKGQLDEGIALIDQVVAADPKNIEAKNLSTKWKKDRTTIQTQLAKVQALMDKQAFADAAKELAPAKDLHSQYPPVVAIERELADKKAANDRGAGASAAAIKRGTALADQRKWSEAVKEFDLAIKADPASPEAHRLRGRAKREAGDLNGSLADFNKAVNLDPNNYQSVLGRGLTKQRLNDAAGAMADFDRGIQLKPDYAASYTYRGRLKLDNKDYAGAKADYDSAIRLDPAPAASWINRGLAKANLNDYRGAIADYTKAVEIDPKNAIAHNNRGIAKQRSGDLNGALADFEKALEIDPNYKTAQTNLGKLKEQMAGGTATPTDSSKGSKFYPVDLTPVGGRKGTPRKVKDIDVDDSSGIRLKSTDEKRLSLSLTIPAAFTASKIALVTNLDDATYLEQGATIATMFVTTDAGTKSFRIQAGVHSSEWNYGVGPKHKRVDNLDIGDNRFLSIFDLGGASPVRGIRFEYVETGAEKWYGHAPGLVLRGITLVGTGASSPVRVDGTIPKVTPTPTPSTPPKPPVGGDAEIFNNGNIYGVYNAPTSPTQFTLNRPYVITSIMTYHWNNARGTTRPGTIAFRGSDGKTYGPWQATGSPGQGGVPNAYWVAKPNITLPAGSYTIIDSDPSTWAQNSGSSGRGHAIMRGYASASSAVAAPPAINRPPTSSPGRYVTAILENRSSEAVHIFPEGDTFGPGNKIAPGEKREVRVLITSTGRIKFTAGRNGQVITTKFWDGDPDSLTRFPRVTFDGRTLVIVTGLR